MVQLKQITRNATFAWSPAKGKPLIASGTIAGAVDASFSQDSELEIWDLDLDNTDNAAFELQPIAKITTERKFYSLAWGYITADKPRGVIAGAMDDGHLNIWDVNSVLANSGTDGLSSLITSNQVHRGAIKAVEFNPMNPKLLMSAGAGGEFNIWDLENPAKPYPAPSRAQRVDDIEAASWNRKVANILATASTNGFTSIWDLKQSREILHLQAPGRRRVSTLAWDPDNPTRIITGCGDDTAPALYVWDLRNSNAPAQVLEAHSAGILSLSWCPVDHDLLLSCGKDNRTILWNPQTPKVLGEFPIASTWAFETQWCPQNPDILANATFEGKITVHRLQSTLPKNETNGTQAGGEDFFDQRQYVSEGGFELKQAPKWLQVPCAASFGFGGAFVSVKNVKGKGEVKITKYISEPKISENASEFEEAVRTADWTTFCQKQVEKSTADSERGNWELLGLLFDSEPRKKLIDYLGIKETDIDELLSDKVSAIKLDKADSDATATADESTSTLQPESKNNRLSGIFGSSDKTDDFLAQLSPNPEARSSKGKFSITATSDDNLDKLITQAILFGKFDHAVDICLGQDRLSDAFMLATQGDAAVRKKVQDAYFARNSQNSSYLRLLQSIVDKNLWDVAENADLADWKPVLVLFCTFAKTDEEFSGLCEVLGQRLERENKVENAKISYLAGKKLDRVVDIWIAEADTQEQEDLKSSQNDSSFSIHARALQGFVEKVTVFKQTKGIAGGDLKALYDKYIEFVEILASQGNLSVAQRYIDLLPGENEAVKAMKNRLTMATTKASIPTTPAKSGARTADPRSRGLPPSLPSAFTPHPFTPASPVAPTLPPSQATTLPRTSSTGPAPPNPASRPSVYNPPATQSSYMPQHSNQYTANQFNPYNPGMQPSIPAISRVSELPPPPPKKTTENWNDPPMLTNPVRTRTPIAPLVKPPSPFTGPSPVPTPTTFQQKATPGPPPTTAKPPQRVKSPPVQGNNPHFTPGPPQQAMSPQIPSLNQFPSARNISNSFTPPPLGASQPPPPPPNGTYRPQSTPAQTRPQYAPPMMQQTGFSASSPAPPPGQISSQYAPPPTRSQYQPDASPPPDAPTTPIQAKPPPSAAKYPPGDRSHIPAGSRPIYDIFSSEMNRIKQLAQAPQQKRIVADVDKRLNILFDLLNNDEGIPADVISELVKLAQALSQRQFDAAQQIHLEIHTSHDQFATWMLGIKRLIDMARVLG